VLLVTVAGSLGTHSHALAQCQRWATGPDLSLGSTTVVQTLSPFLGKLAIGGNFATNGAGTNLVLWNGSTLDSIGSPNGTISALKSYSVPITGSSVLIVGGAFNSVPGLSVSNIAYYAQNPVVVGGTGWFPMNPGFNMTVRAIERFNNAIYAAGEFTMSGSTPVAHIARWDGSAWQPLGSGLNGSCYALKVFNNALYVGGNFTTAGGVDTGGFAKWDGANWSANGGHFGGTIYALEPYQTTLAIGGEFPGMGGAPNIVTYSSNNFYQNLGSGGADNTVLALAADGAILFASGDFGTLGGVSAPRAGYWDGSSWHGAAGPTTGPLALCAYHGEIVAGGGFTSVIGMNPNSPGIARWRETGAPYWAPGTGPATVTVCPYGHTTFSLSPATGFAGATYVWRKDGMPLLNGTTSSGTIVSGAVGTLAAGTTSVTLSLSDVHRADAGVYTCVLTNSCGSSASTGATLNFCYANCDCSTTSPTLGAGDFVCFLGAFRAGCP
jgi:hypothetical protein